MVSLKSSKILMIIFNYHGGSTMIDVSNLFRETNDGFTIYVVEQRFAVGCGYEYFNQYRGKENYIKNEQVLSRRIDKIIRWSQQKVPNVSELVSKCFSLYSERTSASVVDVITALSKLFSVNSHQAAGPDVLDPIIIQEGEVSEQSLSQLVALHRESILQPVIIILLKDNDFDRAKELLSHCPDGINVKFIRNSGETELCRIVNTGVDNIDSFIDSYARQCYSTCSHTHRGILLNKEWSDNSVIRQYGPLLLKIRSSLLVDEKEKVRPDIETLLAALEQEQFDIDNHSVINAFRCIAHLSRVFCLDYGGADINKALVLAKECHNDLLIAQVYRFAHFLTNSRTEQIELLSIAEHLFSENNVEDHAIYCTNNRLLHQFYSESIDLSEFRRMQQTAINNTPGLVGMSHIYNNVGVAYLYSGNPEQALEYFRKGMDYARERAVQRLALMTNMLIARTYMYDKIDEIEIRLLLNYIFDTMGTSKLPFISANYVANIISITMRNNPHLAQELMTHYPIEELIRSAFASNIMGSGSLSILLKHLMSQSNQIDLHIHIPSKKSQVTGFRARFAERHGLNPAIFNTWL